jgi:NADH dehydrogenase [ubiquinone] 1 alpha subcomplex assembly factor 6
MLDAFALVVLAQAFDERPQQSQRGFGMGGNGGGRRHGAFYGINGVGSDGSFAMAEPEEWNRLCAEQVRQQDYDHYLCGLFAPEEQRQGLYALYAFNAEIARTPELVSEPLLGRIRLQWWRDAIAAAYQGGGPHHQVVQALAQTIARFSLPRAPFDAMLDAREAEVENEPIADYIALERLAEATAGGLAALSLVCLGATQPRAQQAGRHVGIAYALIGLLRAVPFHAAQRRSYLPQDRLAAAAVSVDALFEGRKQAGLPVVAAGVAAEARRHLRLARRLRVGIPKVALPALLPATLLDGYLARLARQKYDVFSPKIDLPPLARQLRLAWKASIRRF